jgi:positive phototaxis protein PixI
MTDSVPHSGELLSPWPDATAAGSAPASEQFLRLRIGIDLPVLLPIQQVAEVLTIPEFQIMPVPHLSAWIMGVYNWRGEILWMVDLGHLCGLHPWYQRPLHRSAHAAVILNLLEPSASHTRLPKGQLLGFVVQQVEEIEQCSSNEIQPLPPVSIPPKLAQIAAGYWQKPDQTVLAVLDGITLLSAVL